MVLNNIKNLGSNIYNTLLKHKYESLFMLLFVLILGFAILIYKLFFNLSDLPKFDNYNLYRDKSNNTNGYEHLPHKVKSIEECKILCDNNTDCAGFEIKKFRK